jgi:predicted CXXCH cytochrome family protein
MMGGVSALVWLGLVVLATWPVPAAAEPPVEGCVACHLAIGDDRLTPPAKEFGDSVHAAKGFGCVSCHGGDGDEAGMEAMDPAKGYIGKPARKQISQVCGRCHSDARFMKRYNPALRVDQLTEYITSVHGRRLMELGDDKVATCADCHTAHAIRPPSDPRSSVHPLRVADTCGACHADPKYMEPYNITTDQLQEYRQSVHWKMMSVEGDLSAPTCNDCHGNHGATPPGISWVGNVCGQCHVVQAGLFNKSVLAKVFVEIGTPGCATCHNNHEIMGTGDEMLGVGEGAVCADCHAPDDKGGMAAAAMREQIDGLRGEYDKAHAILLKAENAGMEVSQAEFELQGAKDALVKARAAIHAFTVEAVKKETDTGLTIAAKAYTLGVQALEEVQFRRKGLAVSVVIIPSLNGGLGVKIRQVDRNM